MPDRLAEVVITPEMIEAGMERLQSYCEEWEQPSHLRRGVIEILDAVLCASPVPLSIRRSPDIL
jgi:hypothetical protein